MRNPDQDDYGHRGDKTLVPGSLITYRHFQVDLKRGLIAPMNYRPTRDGVQGSSMMVGTGQRPYTPPQPGEPAKAYEARCIKAGPAQFYSRALREAKGEPHEKSPTVWCTCGFYAHYDPDTDFYPSFRWGRAYHKLAGSEHHADIVVVRAVVEVSGTTIMGKLGVRAGRMKILALTVDWDKRIRPSVVDRYNFFMNRRFDAMSPSAAYRKVMLEDFSSAEEENDADTIARTEAVAYRYGVRHFADKWEMYLAYPKPDISALVDAAPSPPPEPEPDYFEFDASPLYQVPPSPPSALGDILKRQAQIYASQVSQVPWGMVNGVSVGVITVDEVNRIMDEVMPKQKTPFERAILAKQNRSAPPGTGIDRRRGRLR